MATSVVASHWPVRDISRRQPKDRHAAADPNVIRISESGDLIRSKLTPQVLSSRVRAAIILAGIIGLPSGCLVAVGMDSAFIGLVATVLPIFGVLAALRLIRKRSVRRRRGEINRLLIESFTPDDSGSLESAGEQLREAVALWGAHGFLDQITQHSDLRRRKGLPPDEDLELSVNRMKTPPT